MGFRGGRFAFGQLLDVDPAWRDAVAGSVPTKDAGGILQPTDPDAVSIPLAEKGAANGVATLGADSKVPTAQVPTLPYVPTADVGVADGVAELDVTGVVPLGQLPSGTGHNHTGTYINALVADAGTYGDGVTDAAVHLQGLIDTAIAAGGGTVYLPVGDYVLGSSLNLTGQVQLIGAGTIGTRLIYQGAAYALGINAVVGSGVASHGWVVRDLTVDGNGLGAYGIRGGQTGLGDKSAGGLMQSVTVTGFTVAGLHGVAFQLSRWVDCRFEGNKAAGGDGALFDGASTDSTTCDFFACHFRDNKRGLSVLHASGALNFFGCIFEANDDEAIYAERSTAGSTEGFRRGLFDSCHIENNCQDAATTATAAVTWTSLDGQNQRTGTAGAVVFENCNFTQANGKRHLSLLDGDFVIRNPLFLTPANTTGVVAPACAVVFTGTVNERAQTRIWWQDWRSKDFTWAAANVGANVSLFALTTLSTGTTRTGGFVINDGPGNAVAIGPDIVVAPVAGSTLTRPSLNVKGSDNAGQADVLLVETSGGTDALAVGKDGVVKSVGAQIIAGTFPAAGAGAELVYNGTDVYLQGYNRGTSAYIPVRVVGSSVRLMVGTTDRVQADGTGLGFFGAAPVAKPTGVAVDAASIHAALVSLGLIAP